MIEDEVKREETRGIDYGVEEGMSDSLVAIKTVSLGGSSATPIGILYGRMWQEEPGKFLAEMRRLEGEWLETRRALMGVVVSGVGKPKVGEVCGCCGVEYYDAVGDVGGEGAMEAAVSWLENRRVGR